MLEILGKLMDIFFFCKLVYSIQFVLQMFGCRRSALVPEVGCGDDATGRPHQPLVGARAAATAPPPSQSHFPARTHH